MTYVIRSANGLTISKENKEKIFQTEEEAKIHLSFLQIQTTEQWFIVEVKKD